ncbi:hypothetical protein [Streptacidiphilus sp. P02-A3a]|uniref:hypothetical protein n=1 Tax=Streptacidiphilus sp. P02-A3a TaxID=2704468 RepID=UPI0015FC07EB|nr:hypothetical protein [Streptacidiphilus sp. P02-A3a]QMU68200.1 hypothetical protein GXP74_08150 [Streptacidiphilus sp. P02-A3a]
MAWGGAGDYPLDGTTPAGSRVRTYAFVVPVNLSERSVNEYDAQHHLIDHQDL